MKNRLNVFDYFLISIISCGIVCLVYHFFYDSIGYQNLKDFYTGTTIYENHNKFLDLWMFPLYIFTFFLIIPFWNKLPKINLKFDLPDINFNLDKILRKNKCLFFILQIFLSFGYVILHPFDGNFYVLPAVLILFLVSFSIYDSYRNLYKTENLRLSIFALIPVFILLFGNTYNLGNIIPDMHHEGEKTAVWLMHNQFGMKYYKDVMLVHGFADVIPPALGHYAFGGDTVVAFFFGRTLFDNIILILTVLCSYFIFADCPIMIVFSMFQSFNIPQLYVLSFLAFVKAPKNTIWLIFYILFAFIAIFFWTTYGIFWLIASLPLAIYVFVKQQKKYVPIVLLLFILFCIKDFIGSFAVQAVNYIQANIFSFGNDFSDIKLHQLPSDYIKLFSLAVIPYFIIKLFEEFKKENKNTLYIFTIVFAVIFTFVLSGYGLGRIDGIMMQRLRDVSMAYAGALIPMLLLIKNDEKIKYFKYCAVIMLLYLLLTNVGNITKKLSPTKAFYTMNEATTEIKSVINKYSRTKDDFADINCGMNYFIFKKRMPIPYVSFYNVVNSKQSAQISHINSSVVLLQTSLVPRFDNIYPSLRVNSLYGNLLLNDEYSTLETKNNLFLIKENKNKKGVKDLKALDKALATDNLYYLPDAWANSMKTLPLKEVTPKYKLYKNTVIFDKPISGKDIDLMLLTSDGKNSEFEISVNGSESSLKFKTKQSSQLIPFDNFPSWLLNGNIKTITVKNSRNAKLNSVSFYKRNIK